MIWSRKAKLHWVCLNIDGIELEVQVIKGISHWMILDTETGEVLHNGKMDHPLDAIKMIEYITHSKTRKAFNGGNNEYTY